MKKLLKRGLACVFILTAASCEPYEPSTATCFDSEKEAAPVMAFLPGDPVCVFIPLGEE